MMTSSVVAKVLMEIGKALGKAIIAGVGLELARAASGHVKRVVGPKDAAALDADKKADSTPLEEDELARVRRENEALRKELDALRVQREEARSA